MWGNVKGSRQRGGKAGRVIREGQRAVVAREQGKLGHGRGRMGQAGNRSLGKRKTGK